MNTSLTHTRINRVLDHIQAHLHQKLTVTELARVACFSPFHFHRLFHAEVGETLTGFIQRLRIEKAALLLANHPRKTVTEIALEVGFSGSASFARLFRRQMGITASEWRKRPFRLRGMQQELARATRKGQGAVGARAASKSMRPSAKSSQACSFAQNVSVSIVTLNEMTVAYLRNVGPYRGNVAMFEGQISRLVAWAIPRKLALPTADCMSIFHDDPRVTDKNRLRVSIGIVVPEGTAAQGDVGVMRIAGGKYAVGHFEVHADEYPQAWDYFLDDWLPHSGFECDDRPLFERYRNDPRRHPDKKHIVDIYLPVTA